VDVVIGVGVLTPHAAPGPEVEFPAMAPGRLSARIALIHSETEASGDPLPPATLAALTARPLLDDSVDRLLTDPVDLIGYASTTTGYVLGGDAEQALLRWLAQRTDRPVAATCAAAARALHALKVRRVALVGAPWFPAEFNELGAGYFTGQGFEVVCSAPAEVSHDAGAVEPAVLIEWAAGHVPDIAEAVFLGGNGFRTAAAIGPLEEAIARPVLTANQVLLWQLLGSIDSGFDVLGYGQLFNHTP
jgi:maleate isomerase